jgi:hypothetical protein
LLVENMKDDMGIRHSQVYLDRDLNVGDIIGNGTVYLVRRATTARNANGPLAFRVCTLCKRH